MRSWLRPYRCKWRAWNASELRCSVVSKRRTGSPWRAITHVPPTRERQNDGAGAAVDRSVRRHDQAPARAAVSGTAGARHDAGAAEGGTGQCHGGRAGVCAAGLTAPRAHFWRRSWRRCERSQRARRHCLRTRCVPVVSCIWVAPALRNAHARVPPPSFRVDALAVTAVSALNHCYAMLCDVYRKSVVPICDNMARYARSQSEWRNAQSRDDETEKRRATSEAALAAVSSTDCRVCACIERCLTRHPRLRDAGATRISTMTRRWRRWKTPRCPDA